MNLLIFHLAVKSCRTFMKVSEGSILFSRLNKDYTETIEGIRSALIDTHDGKKVPLEQVADIVSVTGPSSISRENVQRKIVVSANVSGRDIRSVVNDIQTECNAKYCITRRLPD